MSRHASGPIGTPPLVCAAAVSYSRCTPPACAAWRRCGAARLARGEDEGEDETPEAAARKLAGVHEAVDVYFRASDPGAVLEVDPPRMGLIRAAFSRLKSLSRWAGGTPGSHESAREVAQLRADVQRLQQLVHLALCSCPGAACLLAERLVHAWCRADCQLRHKQHVHVQAQVQCNS